MEEEMSPHYSRNSIPKGNSMATCKLFWRTNTKIHRGCVMVLSPSNQRCLLLKQSPLDVAWWVLCTERTTMGGSIPSKPQKTLNHPLSNSLYHEKVKSRYEQWDKEQWHIRTTFCCYKKKRTNRCSSRDLVLWRNKPTNRYEISTLQSQVPESSLNKSGTPEPPDVQRPL